MSSGREISENDWNLLRCIEAKSPLGEADGIYRRHLRAFYQSSTEDDVRYIRALLAEARRDPSILLIKNGKGKTALHMATDLMSTSGPEEDRKKQERERVCQKIEEEIKTKNDMLVQIERVEIGLLPAQQARTQETKNKIMKQGAALIKEWQKTKKVIRLKNEEAQRDREIKPVIKKILEIVEPMEDQVLLRAAYDGFGNTPLHTAIAKRQTAIVKEIIRAWPGLIAAENARENTPLHTAVFAGEPEIVDVLLAQGADPTAEDQEGYTPFMSAVIDNQADTVAVFLEQAPDLAKAMSREGNLAIHIVMDNMSEWLQDIMSGDASDEVRRDLNNAIRMIEVLIKKDSPLQQENWDESSAAAMLEEMGALIVRLQKNISERMIMPITTREEKELAMGPLQSLERTVKKINAASTKTGSKQGFLVTLSAVQDGALQIGYIVGELEQLAKRSPSELELSGAFALPPPAAIPSSPLTPQSLNYTPEEEALPVPAAEGEAAGAAAAGTSHHSQMRSARGALDREKEREERRNHR